MAGIKNKQYPFEEVFEMANLKEMLIQKALLQPRLTAFVYPCGANNRTVSEIAKEGYKLAFGGCDWSVEYLYRIPRYEIFMKTDLNKLMLRILNDVVLDV